MPRTPRNYIKTSYFHVMVQGINKEYIFENKKDIKYYIQVMKEMLQDLDIKIVSYCIMNNHAHLLIYTKQIADLSKYMQKVNTKYAGYYNVKYNRVGYVFRDRYKSEGIYSEKQLYCCVNYIYNNPVKANMCKIPEEYPYSNIKEYKGKLESSELYKFLGEENELNSKDIVNEYLIKNHLKKEELLKNKEILKEIVVILKKEKNMSLRKIEEVLEISRETIRKLAID